MGVYGCVFWLLVRVKKKGRKNGAKTVIPNHRFSWPQRAKPSRLWAMWPRSPLFSSFFLYSGLGLQPKPVSAHPYVRFPGSSLTRHKTPYILHLQLNLNIKLFFYTSFKRPPTGSIITLSSDTSLYSSLISVRYPSSVRMLITLSIQKRASLHVD